MPAIILENKGSHYLISGGIGCVLDPTLVFSKAQVNQLPPEEKSAYKKHRYKTTSSAFYLTADDYSRLCTALFKAIIKRKEVRKLSRVCSFLVAEGILPTVSKIMKDNVERMTIDFFFGETCFQNAKTGQSDVCLLFALKFNNPKYKDIFQRVKTL